MRLNKKLNYFLTFLLFLMIANSQAFAQKKIVFWIDRDEISQFTEQTVVDLVNEYNTIQSEATVELINVTTSGSGDSSAAVAPYKVKIMTALAARRGPDIWWIYDADMAIMVSGKFVEPVPDWLITKMKDNGIYEWILDSLSMGTNKVWGVPHDVMWGAMLYNKQLFREVGLDPEKGPKNWEDLIDYAKKLSTYDSSGKLVRSGFNVRFTGGLVGIADKWAHFLISAGGSVLNEDASQAAFNSEAGIEALTLYVDLVNKYKVDSLDFPRGIESFARSEIAMMGPREAFMIPWIEKFGTDIELGASYMPAKENTGSSGATRMISVNANSKVKKEVWDFLDWLNQPKQTTRLYVENLQLPAYKPLADSPAYNKIPLIKVWTTHPNIQARMVSPKLGEVYPVIGRAIQSAVYKKQGVKEALDEAAIEVNKILSK